MKLACSSTAFDQMLRSGDLTQLEWIDACAREFAADGAVFDVRHFPRIDTDYLAQVKKLAADLGLSVAALARDGFFSSDAERVEQAFEIAAALGAPLLASTLPPVTAADWNQTSERLNEATSLAKKFNITIALRNEPHSFAAGVADMKRVSKEADSAWLRFGPQFECLEAGGDPRELLNKTVLAWSEPERAGDAVEILGDSYRGFLVLDASQGNATVEGMKNAVASLRRRFLEVNRI